MPPPCGADSPLTTAGHPGHCHLKRVLRLPCLPLSHHYPIGRRGGEEMIEKGYGHRECGLHRRVVARRGGSADRRLRPRAAQRARNGTSLIDSICDVPGSAPAVRSPHRGRQVRPSDCGHRRRSATDCEIARLGMSRNRNRKNPSH
jgi:hypothetical protein